MVTTGVTVAEKVIAQEEHRKPRKKPFNRQERGRCRLAADVLYAAAGTG
jgi:hypothetical protein